MIKHPPLFNNCGGVAESSAERMSKGKCDSFSDPLESLSLPSAALGTSWPRGSDNGENKGECFSPPRCKVSPAH